jgi:hypothetical protein
VLRHCNLYEIASPLNFIMIDGRVACALSKSFATKGVGGVLRAYSQRPALIFHHNIGGEKQSLNI